jgi:hypothetical protein
VGSCGFSVTSTCGRVSEASVFSSFREWFVRYRALSLALAAGTLLSLWFKLYPGEEAEARMFATQLVEDAGRYRRDPRLLERYVISKIDPHLSLEVVELPDVTSSRDGLMTLLPFLSGDSAEMYLAVSGVYFAKESARTRVLGDLHYRVARNGQVLTGERRIELLFTREPDDYRLTRLFVAGPPNDKPEARP